MNPRKTYYFIMGLLGFIPLLLTPLLFSKDFELVRHALLGMGSTLILVTMAISLTSLFLLVRLGPPLAPKSETKLESQDELESRIRTSVGQKLAHDLRSPLSVLSILESQLTQVSPEHRELLKLTTEKIGSVANKYGPRPSFDPIDSAITAPNDPTQSFSTLIEDNLRQIFQTLIKDAKNSPTLNFDCEEGFGLFTSLSPTQLQQSIQPMISVAQSLQKESGQYRLSIRLRRSREKALFVFTLIGSCQPDEVLPLLRTYFSDLKTGVPDTWSGSQMSKTSDILLKVNYRAQEGCFWECMIPLAKPPPWFPETIQIDANTQIVICDDDASIHKGWSHRLNVFNLPPIKHFMAPHELINYVAEKTPNTSPSSIYLIDYELNDSQYNGVQLIEKLKLSHQSILVTSRFDHADLQSQCKQMGLKLLPKHLFTQIPINYL